MKGSKLKVSKTAKSVYNQTYEQKKKESGSLRFSVLIFEEPYLSQMRRLIEENGGSKKAIIFMLEQIFNQQGGKNHETNE